MQELVGKLIYEIWINGTQDVLVFKTPDGSFIYDAEGDCCSESWFADIEGVAFLLNSLIRSVEEIPKNNFSKYDFNAGRKGTQEDERVYGYAIKTSQGDASIIFRNSSNGWYGGWCDYAGNIKLHPEEMELRGPLIQITKDWSA